jgi:hypothetical protein
MSKTVFKGAINTGLLSAMFHSDFSNLDADVLLIVNYLKTGGLPREDHADIALGHTGIVRIRALKKGLLEVRVVTSHDDDRGRLQVASGTTVKDDESTKGSVLWVYGIEPSRPPRRRRS